MPIVLFAIKYNVTPLGFGKIRVYNSWKPKVSIILIKLSATSQLHSEISLHENLIFDSYEWKNESNLVLDAECLVLYFNLKKQNRQREQ